MNFLPNETQSLVCKVEGRKNHANATIEEGNEDEDESPRTYVLSMDYSNISVTAKNAYQSYVLHRRLFPIDAIGIWVLAGESMEEWLKIKVF